MKYVLLSIFVLIAAQPLQAMECDMHNGQDTSHSQHGSMHDGPMDDDTGQDKDCCDHDPEEANDDCGSVSHCRVCSAGMLAVNVYAAITVFGSNSQQYRSVADHPLNSFSSPPFRPPIA